MNAEPKKPFEKMTWLTMNKRLLKQQRKFFWCLLVLPFFCFSRHHQLFGHLRRNANKFHYQKHISTNFSIHFLAHFCQVGIFLAKSLVCMYIGWREILLGICNALFLRTRDGEELFRQTMNLLCCYNQSSIWKYNVKFPTDY